MNIFDSLGISSSALKAQRVQLNVISGNMANVETTHTPEGGPYKKRNVVFESAPVSFSGRLHDAMTDQAQGVRVPRIQQSNAPPLTFFSPSHPDANAKGYVAKPNINIVEEMADMMAARRAYEANVTMIKTTKRMALKALEIGR